MLSAGFGLALYGLYNLYRFGSFTDFGGAARTLGLEAYAPSQVIEAAGTLLISPGRGVFVYAPLLVIGVFVAWRRRTDDLVVAGGLAFLVVLVVHLGNPGSGTNWADRYLLPTLPVLCALAATPVRALFAASVTLACVGALIQVPNTVGYFSRYYLEQADKGRSQKSLYWSASRAPLVGVWGSTRRQLSEAGRSPEIQTMAPAAPRVSGARTSDQESFSTVAAWWWFLPMIGVAWQFGAVLSAIVIGLVAFGLLRLAAGSRRRRPERRAPPPERSRSAAEEFASIST